MLTLSETAILKAEETSDLGVYAQWQYGDNIPTKGAENSQSDVFAVKNDKYRGSKYTRPEGATGLIVSASEKLTVVAAWRKNSDDGPWQIYSEQEKDTTAYYYLGDTKVLFVGWV